MKICLLAPCSESNNFIIFPRVCESVKVTAIKTFLIFSYHNIYYIIKES